MRSEAIRPPLGRQVPPHLVGHGEASSAQPTAASLDATSSRKSALAPPALVPLGRRQEAVAVMSSVALATCAGALMATRPLAATSCTVLAIGELGFSAILAYRYHNKIHHAGLAAPSLYDCAVLPTSSAFACAAAAAAFGRLFQQNAAPFLLAVFAAKTGLLGASTLLQLRR